MHLHILKNSCTFEVRNTLEKFKSTFLNQNKAQAIRCKSFNLPESGVFRSDLGLCFTLKNYKMRNTPKKNIHLTHHAPQSNPSRNHVLRVIKVECEGPDQFAIHVKVRNRSTTVIRFSNPDLLEEIIESLSRVNQ